MNKKEIIQSIEQLEKAVEMETFIRIKLKEFERFAKVNKRFIDALKSTGEYHAYIDKDKGATIFNVYAAGVPYQNRVEFRICIHDFNDKELTWKMIEERLSARNFSKQLQEKKELLDIFDVELVILQEIQDRIEKVELKCFSLSEIKYKLKEMVYHANKQ